MTTTPLISIICPVYRPDPDALSECISSVLRQTMDDWELILVDQANPPQIIDVLERAAEDGRVRVLRLSENLGIAGGSQAGLESCRGDFVALLDHDDLLSPVALERMAGRIATVPTADYLYSDEDKISTEGAFYEPFFKPDWSPELFRNLMYTSHLSVIRRSCAEQVGGFRSECEGSQDYDLVLRVSEIARRIEHIPEVLYHWRASPASTAFDTSAKPIAINSAVRALQEHCDRTGISATVEPRTDYPGTYRIVRDVVGNPLVSLVIPSYGKRAEVWGEETCLLSHFITSVENNTSYENFEYVIIHDVKTPQSTLDYVTSIATRPLTLIPYEEGPEGFNFSHKVNTAALQAIGEYLCILNDDLEVISDGWLEEMLGIAQEKDVGAVGGKFYFSNDTIQHAGVSCCVDSYHMFYRLPRDEPGPFFLLQVAREVAAVTGACLLMDRDLYFEVGGLTERLPNNFNDIDLCLKLNFKGYRNVWTPHAELYHFESLTRDNTVNESENEFFRARWSGITSSDPYMNPNLELAWPNWEPRTDWLRWNYSWPEPATVANFDPAAYVRGNPDLLAASMRDPDFDPLDHFQGPGRLEARRQVRIRPRPPEDWSRGVLVPATENNFTVDGYVAANPDVHAAVLADPAFDIVEHFRANGKKEKRKVWLSAQSQAE